MPNDDKAYPVFFFANSNLYFMAGYATHTITPINSSPTQWEMAFKKDRGKPLSFR